MRVTVANPPWPGEGFGARSDVRWPHKRRDKYIEYPIYLAYTVAVLEEAGFDVSFVDAVMEELDIPGFVDRLQALKPHLLVMECSTPSIDYDVESARQVKKALPDTKVAFIGSHSTFFHRQILSENPQVDAIVRGEFEITVRELARTIDNDLEWSAVQGLSYRQGDVIVENPDRAPIEDLDSLPFPARHIVRSSGYRAAIYSGSRCTSMVSSRGCPFHCVFCVWPNTLYGHRFRARSAENVVDEMQKVQQSGIDEVYFDDDTFTIDRKRVMEICRLIKERGINMSWIAQARVDTVDREMLSRMKEAGCHYILFGIESGSPEMLETMKKRITLDRAREAIRLCRELGIKSQAFFLFGVPGETQQTIQQTISFAKELGASSTQFAVAIPQPGSPMYQQCVENNWLVYDNWEDFASGNALIETPQLSRKETEAARIRAYREYYFRPRFILQEASRIRHPRDIRRIWRGAKSVLSRLRFFESARGQ
jgi:anaerobic magnesium-protoporphyrin IX monomethyl ester cyclase